MMLELWVASAFAWACGDSLLWSAELVLEGDVLSLPSHDDPLRARFLLRPTEVYWGEAPGDIVVGLFVYGVGDMGEVQPGTHLALVLSHREASGDYLGGGCGTYFRRFTDPRTGQHLVIGEEGQRRGEWAPMIQTLAHAARFPDGPVSWTLAQGWRVERVHAPQDLDGDGKLDLVVEVLGEGTRQSLLLLGPLVRRWALPREADLALPHTVAGIGDFTGDGQLDLQVLVVPAEGPVRSAVVPGPLRRGVAPQLGPERPGRVESDYDGDGRPDYVEISHDAELARVWTGPEPTWGQGRPTVTFDLRGVSLPVPMDTDGDGRPELWGRGAVDRVYRGRLRGRVDLASQPEALRPWPVGDVDGDGVHDWRAGVYGALFAGPWSLDPDARRELFHAEGMGWLRSLGMDLTGDGRPELVRGPAPYGVVAGGRDPALSALRLLSGPLLAAWVEEGLGWALVRAEQGLELLPLGPATAVAGPTAPAPPP
jgi:hypothetical protein